MIPEEITETTEELTTNTQSPRRVIRKTTRVNPVVLDDTPPQHAYAVKKTIFRTYQIAWYILGVIEILLAFRLLLKLIGANPTSGFSTFIYALSAPFAVPFLGVVSPSVTGNSILEWSTFIAMGVYAVFVWLITELVHLVKPVKQEEVEQNVDYQ